ncbi:MAG: hypothetical protein LBV20_05255 [Treponema sp.]|jgi:hypothetical protein|nr:hypothetical protein [Treponema sp.]
MDFTINGQTANITLENEETLGEFLSGVEHWLHDSEYSLSGIIIDGEEIAPSDISEVFSKKLNTINTIDIKTSSKLELYLEALIITDQYLEMYEKSSFEDKKSIQTNWEDGAAASFIKNREAALFNMLHDVFSGLGLNLADAKSIIMERIRELENPAKELANMHSFIEDCAKRLEDLPLDLQTGKDFRAAETIQFFSGINEKLFRIVAIMEQQGIKFESINVENQTFKAFIEEFSTALQELLSAYESKDSVLVGDLAEYELAPRLRSFYAAVNNPVQL